MYHRAMSIQPHHTRGLAMRSILRDTAVLSLLSLALLSHAGCQVAARTPQPTPDMAEIAGSYALVSVDAKQLPAAVMHGEASVEVRSGTFTFGADGRCSTRTVFVPPNGQEVVREVGAVYSKAGAKLTMWWDGAGATTGSVEGNTFTMDNEGMLFVYRR